MTAVELKLDFKLMGQLWGVYCEDFQENWPNHNSITRHPYLYNVTYLCVNLQLNFNHSITL